MSEPLWNFERPGPNEEEHGISEWDQFDKEDLGIDITLLREATQNSLDAREVSEDETAVRVRLRWLRKDELSEPAWLDELLTPLAPHLAASGRTASTSEYAALIVEDFGTCGLTGRTDDPGDTGNFRSFFYRHSSSHKGGPARGRWGLGKLVFAHMSGWSCWFGLTTRRDSRTVLMGKAAIGPRQVNGQYYRPFPRWAIVKEGVEHPVEDTAILERFSYCFRLQREPGDTGLSVVVPWPKSGSDTEAIRRCVLNEWAVPILRHRLVLDIQGEVFDAATVRALLPDVLDESAARFIEAVASGETPPSMLPEIRAHPEQKLTEDRVDPASFERLRSSYSAGEMIAVRIPVVVYPKADQPKQGHVDLWIAQAQTGTSPVSLRLRDDITVPRGALLRADGVHSALLADTGSVALFLADAEPPAHDTWTATARLKERWKYAPQTLNLIRTAPARLHQLLASGAEEDLPNELVQFFWFEDRSTAGSKTFGQKVERKPDRTPDPPDNPPPPRPRQLTIDREDAGFTVRAGQGLTDDLLPCQIRVRVAYDLEDADPFRSWSRYDFDLGDKDGDVEVEYGGLSYLKREGNEILVEAQDRDFYVRAHGFDRNRDLEVRVNRLRESAS